MRIRTFLRRLGATLIFPQSCVLCGPWVGNQDLVPLCCACGSGLKPLQNPLIVHCGDLIPGPLICRYGQCQRCCRQPPDFDEGWSWGAYNGELRQLIRHFKYGGHQRLVEPLSDLMLKAFRRHQISQPDVLIPVPSHSQRVRQRGFDAVRLLAKRVALKLDVRMSAALSRVRNTIPLYGLDRTARRKNLAGAFRVRQTSELEGPAVLLIDDILTTGTTSDELSKVLRRDGGVRSVRVLAIARTIRQFQR